MFKKLIVICAFIIIFFLCVIVFIFSSGSNKTGKLPSEDFTSVFEGFEKENFPDYKQNENENEFTPPEAQDNTIYTESKEIVYRAPYTPDEIKNIFEEDKELFEAVKDIRMPEGCNYLYAERSRDPILPCVIEFYFFDKSGETKHTARDTKEDGGYGEIYEFFTKYRDISFIHAIDSQSAQYSEENLIAQFGFHIDVPVFSDYIPWAEIRYNRTGGEIEEKITGEYMMIPLDEHWYYIYSNVYPK